MSWTLIGLPSCGDQHHRAGGRPSTLMAEMKRIVQEDLAHALGARELSSRGPGVGLHRGPAPAPRILLEEEQAAGADVRPLRAAVAPSVVEVEHMALAFMPPTPCGNPRRDLQHAGFLHHHRFVGDDWSALRSPDAVEIGRRDLADAIAGALPDGRQRRSAAPRPTDGSTSMSSGIFASATLISPLDIWGQQRRRLPTGDRADRAGS